MTGLRFFLFKKYVPVYTVLLAVKLLKTHLRLLVRPLSVHVLIFQVYFETQSFNFIAADPHHFHAVMDPAIRVDAYVNSFFRVTCYLLERHIYFTC